MHFFSIQPNSDIWLHKYIVVDQVRTKYAEVHEKYYRSIITLRRWVKWKEEFGKLILIFYVLLRILSPSLPLSLSPSLPLSLSPSLPLSLSPSLPLSLSPPVSLPLSLSLSLSKYIF